MPSVPVRLQPANVAIPVGAATVLAEQARAAPTSFTDSVIELAAVTVLPPASSTVTTGWGERHAVAAAPETQCW